MYSISKYVYYSQTFSFSVKYLHLLIVSCLFYLLNNSHLFLFLKQYIYIKEVITKGSAIYVVSDASSIIALTLLFYFIFYGWYFHLLEQLLEVLSLRGVANQIPKIRWFQQPKAMIIKYIKGFVFDAIFKTRPIKCGLIFLKEEIKGIRAGCMELWQRSCLSMELIESRKPCQEHIWLCLSFQSDASSLLVGKSW